MKVYAVIAEFNPFHNGHAYLVNEIKKTGDCAVVAIMSGSFVERGDIAVIDKYARAETAVRCGYDLVLELPAPWCFSGAEYFALGGVGIADGIGVVDDLLFGSESGDIEELTDCEAKLSSTQYEEALKAARNVNRSVNAANIRADVFASLYGDDHIFKGSNNLLALEYLHALRTLGSKIEPVTVKRIGNDFNSDDLDGICSATAIRGALMRGEREFSAFVPETAEKILLRELNENRQYSLTRLDTAVIAMLRASDHNRLSKYLEMSGGIENRLTEAALTAKTVEEAVKAVKSKRYSESRVRRAILSAMLEVTPDLASERPLFTTVLAANERGREVLSMARNTAEIAILSKMSDSRKLKGTAQKQFALHLRAERLSELCCLGEPRRVGAVMV